MRRTYGRRVVEAQAVKPPAEEKKPLSAAGRPTRYMTEMEYAEHQRSITKKYFDADPERLVRNREQSRVNYEKRIAKLRQDPVAYAAFLRELNENSKAWGIGKRRRKPRTPLK